MKLSSTLLASLALGLAAVGSVALPVPAAAAPADDAGKFIEVLSQQAFGILRDPSMNRTAAKAKFRTLLRQNFAIQSIGDRLIRRYRNQITPAQYSAYMAAFPDFVVNAYADRLYDYSRSTLKVVRVQPVGSGFAVFSTVSQAGGNPLDAQWSVISSGGKYQITNLIVSGINLSLTQEADFSSYIQRNGFDALVKFMESKRV